MERGGCREKPVSEHTCNTWGRLWEHRQSELETGGQRDAEGHRASEDGLAFGGVEPVADNTENSSLLCLSFENHQSEAGSSSRC